MVIQCDIGKPDIQKLRVCSDMLVRLNLMYLQRLRGRVPRLYKSGVRYKREKPVPGRMHIEHFRRIPTILRVGSGDCEDLCAWRVAELRFFDGVKAVPWIIRPSRDLFHVQVKLPGGKIEDPSARLGMHVPEGVRL